jgi:transposase
MTKTEKIRQTRQETLERRTQQKPLVVEAKLCPHSLSADQKKTLSAYFCEARWLWNWIVADTESRLNNTTWKVKEVEVKVGDHLETRRLEHLPAQVRRGVVDEMHQALKGLSALKRNGHKVGRLKFKREVRCLTLPQHGVTYKLVGKEKVKIAGIRKPLRVRGLSRIPEGAEVSCARLLKKPSGYYLHVVCWLNKVDIPRREPIGDVVGVDFGVAHQITLSNGMKVKWQVGESRRLKGLQRKLARQKAEGANYRKTKAKLEREHERIGNIRRDIRRKVGSFLRRYKIVCYQAEQFQRWARLWGKQIGETEHRSIGESEHRFSVSPFHSFSDVCPHDAILLGVRVSSSQRRAFTVVR